MHVDCTYTLQTSPAWVVEACAQRDWHNEADTLATASGSPLAYCHSSLGSLHSVQEIESPLRVGHSGPLHTYQDVLSHPPSHPLQCMASG